jgi:DNA polymerase-3 subunit epsilon
MDTIRPRKLGLWYDVETTGLPLFSEPSEDPRQPHIVQLGAILVDMGTREEIEVLDAIVRPDGWTIPDDVAAIHGVTTERALADGLPALDVLQRFLTMWGSSEQLVRAGFNESFDARLVRIALFRHFDKALADKWKAGLAHDVMKVCTPICKLPPTAKMVAARRGGQFKSPKLSEAYEHFFGEKLEGAHSALVDARATLRIHFHLEDLKQPARAAA